MAERSFSDRIRYIGTPLLTLGYPCVQLRVQRGRYSGAVSCLAVADQLAA
ncbi:hypothetical protein SADFL11_00012910 [Roseibium alexandrii DFL-11]|uniref:Uncharacterized protein n=1 Tax=Roseibium alexandrii (strain DSM 17067 / NCIMB 14079 / DFL-11) TaxID=244592 RepID=A0A5E8UW41_ROSAD|nr:hypothetical protein SADFL11_00012910 [Roseibium alexandrii DFL-11]